ncbi:MAG: hypothetical protein GVY30_01090 [Chloroflexi bacterium]|jgi:DNA-binding NarL/FixJ family response regulator|nr:hypothetical protein [Chloroflexota bacterium]
MAEGKTTAQIAEALVVTENTVRTHVGNLLGKVVAKFKTSQT